MTLHNCEDALSSTTTSQIRCISSTSQFEKKRNLPTNMPQFIERTHSN